jgi:hypothetical protein
MPYNYFKSPALRDKIDKGCELQFRRAHEKNPDILLYALFACRIAVNFSSEATWKELLPGCPGVAFVIPQSDIGAMLEKQLYA